MKTVSQTPERFKSFHMFFIDKSKIKDELTEIKKNSKFYYQKYNKENEDEDEYESDIYNDINNCFCQERLLMLNKASNNSINTIYPSSINTNNTIKYNHNNSVAKKKKISSIPYRCLTKNISLYNNSLENPDLMKMIELKFFSSSSENTDNHYNKSNKNIYKNRKNQIIAPLLFYVDTFSNENNDKFYTDTHNNSIINNNNSKNSNNKTIFHRLERKKMISLRKNSNMFNEDLMYDYSQNFDGLYKSINYTKDQSLSLFNEKKDGSKKSYLGSYKMELNKNVKCSKFNENQTDNKKLKNVLKKKLNTYNNITNKSNCYNSENKKKNINIQFNSYRKQGNNISDKINNINNPTFSPSNNKKYLKYNNNNFRYSVNRNKTLDSNHVYHEISYLSSNNTLQKSVLKTEIKSLFSKDNKMSNFLK